MTHTTISKHTGKPNLPDNHFSRCYTVDQLKWALLGVSGNTKIRSLFADGVDVGISDNVLEITDGGNLTEVEQ